MTDQSGHKIDHDTAAAPGIGPACAANDSLLVRLEARPRLAPTQIKALAILKWVKAAERDGYYCVDGEFHAETRRILIEYGLCEPDPNGSIIPSDDPLVRI